MFLAKVVKIFKPFVLLNKFKVLNFYNIEIVVYSEGLEGRFFRA